LVRRWEQAVYRIAWRVLGGADEAEEVRQTVFLRLLQRPGRLPKPDRFAGWIRRCTVNAAVTAIRRRRRHATSPLPPDLPAADDPSSPDADEAARLRRALDTVAAEDRALLSLRFDEGLSFAEIGEALGRPASTVKSQHARLIERLRVLLAEPAARPTSSGRPPMSQESNRHV
jgi:RNA polymerase sigma-70 factor (ECF subfamily)